MPIRMVPLSAAVLFFAGLLSAEVALGQPGRGPANVVVAPARKSEIAVSVDFVGTVMPTRTSVVGSPVDGRVLSFPLNEGDRVNRGDTLTQLRTRRLEIMRDGAQATAEALNQELLQLQRGSRKQEIAESEARMHAAEALYEYTKSNIERIRLAEARGGATADELADAVMRNRQADRLFVAARSAHELVEEGPREEEIAKAQAALLAQQEEVARIEDEIARHTIVAPFDGYISAEHTEIGEWVRQGDPVAEVIEVDEVDVQVVVFEKYINAVRIGAPASVRVAGLEGRTLEGRVASIIPQADLQSRSFPVKIRLRNEITEHGPLLKSGMFANVQ
ncbi:MAG: efflux RND transporter periplasmic adaptor subunit, partial [Pirellulales bacterium]